MCMNGNHSCGFDQQMPKRLWLAVYTTPSSLQLTSTVFLCPQVSLQITQQQKCRRVRAQAEAEESTSGNVLDEDSGPEVEVPSALAGNNKFAEALKAALKRSGGDAAILTSGEPAKPREKEPPWVASPSLFMCFVRALTNFFRRCICPSDGDLLLVLCQHAASWF